MEFVECSHWDDPQTSSSWGPRCWWDAQTEMPRRQPLTDAEWGSGVLKWAYCPENHRSTWVSGSQALQQFRVICGQQQKGIWPSQTHWIQFSRDASEACHRGSQGQGDIGISQEKENEFKMQPQTQEHLALKHQWSALPFSKECA